MAIAGTLKERPLTHDLLTTILQALGARTERVVVNDLKDDTYFARLILNVENEFQHTIVEIDARPSDVARWRLTRARQFMLTLMSGTRWKT